MANAKKTAGWLVDTRTGIELNISQPFNTRTAAIAFAKANGLGKKAVRSRPAGFVVER